MKRSCLSFCAVLTVFAIAAPTHAQDFAVPNFKAVKKKKKKPVVPLPVIPRAVPKKTVTSKAKPKPKVIRPAPVTSPARTQAYGVRLGAFAGMSLCGANGKEKCKDVDPGSSIGVSAAYEVTPMIGVGFDYNSSSLEKETKTDKVEIAGSYLMATVHTYFKISRSLETDLTLGVGKVTYDLKVEDPFFGKSKITAENSLAFKIGVLMNYPVTKSILVGVGGSYLMSGAGDVKSGSDTIAKDQDLFNLIQIGAAFTYRL